MQALDSLLALLLAFALHSLLGRLLALLLLERLLDLGGVRHLMLVLRNRLSSGSFNKFN